jgi:hypothetical protein
MPATAAQVFGPTTVDPGFNTTGEKTLLTMNTTLPAGGNNIILVSYAGYTSLDARGTFRLYKGSTLLYETKITNEYFTHIRTRSFPHLLIAVDSSPQGNDSYSFRINITAAAASTSSVHVQGMVIKAYTAVWGYNTTAVNIASGGTGTVTSIDTSFPSGSKVAVIATVYAGAATTTTGDYLVGAGNIKLKSGSTVVSSNQFNTGSYRDVYPLRASLIYLDTPTSSSQTYSVEITNGSSQAYNCYAEIVAFDVADAAFLDTGSVAVATTQTTVGNLSTTLSGDVAVIALAAAERTTANDGDTFAANAVVLQRDNSSTDQVSNLVAWYIFRNSFNARSGVLPLFRYDTGVSNPSYQVKMTASSGSPNGEAKILAFMLVTVVSVSDSGSGMELVEVNVTTAVLDAGAGVEAVDMSREMVDSGAGVEEALVSTVQSDSGAGVDAMEVYVPAADFGGGVDETLVNIPTVDSGVGAEAVDMAKEAVDSGSGFDYFTGGLQKYVDDAGAGVESVDMMKESVDSGAGTETVNMASETVDSGVGVDVVNMAKESADSGIGVEAVNMTREVADSGVGVELVPFMLKETPDSGVATELVNMLKEAGDAGSGAETIISPQFNALADSGVGADATLLQVPQSDYGAGVDAVNMARETVDGGLGMEVVEMAREIADFGAGVEAVYVSATVISQDFASGVDVVGVTGYVAVGDAGVGVDVFEWFLSMYGMVLIDTEDIGYHSIPYRDWMQKNIPIQVHRRSAGDKVYVDEAEIGDVIVEWDDKVSDVIPGERVVIVTGVVKLYD